MKKGYWVVRAQVNNLEEYSKYIDIATSIIENHNGRFLIRGGKQTEFEKEGFEWTVVLEFNSYDDAIDCYKSKEYQSALKYVKNSALRMVSIVEGI